MPPALSVAVKDRITQHLAEGRSVRAIASAEQINERVIYKIQANIRAFGSHTAPRTSALGRPPRITAVMKAGLRVYLEDRPWAYQDEMQLYFCNDWGVVVDRSTISRLLKSMGITRQMSKRNAAERDQDCNTSANSSPKPTATMSSSREIEIREHGFTAVSRDVDNALLHGAPNLQPPEPLLVADLPFPSDSLVQNVHAYASQHLPPPTFHHSMRVYHFGLAILRTQFPSWHISPSTYALACLLHDIGTTDANITSTLLSFEYHGAFIANSLLATELHAPQAQVEAVVEAIIRHQDLGTTGMITTLGQILQLATIFDNMGGHAELVHGETVRDVVREWPRLGWSGCFAGTIRRENGLKPWCHTTSLGEREFPEGVEGNRVMKEFE